MLLVNAAALDSFWPTVLNNPPKDLWMDREKDGLTTGASSVTISGEPPQNIPVDINSAIDGLLVKTVIGNLKILAEFPEKLQQRLEDSRAGRSHLNWVAFQNLPPSVITAALASDELRGTSALSLCIDQVKLQGDHGEGDLNDPAAALGRFTGLKQLCLLQWPDRDSDNASARICSSSSFGRGGRKFLTLSSTIRCAQVFPVVHMSRFVDHRGEDSPDVAADDVQQYQNYYTMGNTLLDTESFAVGSNPEKAILPFAHKGSSSPPGHSSVSPIPAGFFDYELPPKDPSRVRLGDIQPGSWVVPLDSSAQICDHQAVADEVSWDQLPPLSELPPPAWALAYLTQTDLSDPTQPSASTDQRGRSSSLSDDTIVDDNDQQRPFPIANPPEVVGGLTDFLRETVPGSDIATWEEEVKEVERDIRTGRASITTGKREIDIGVMAENRARALLNRLM
ncbi:hypothetical protein BDV10DRAFT_198465 [Aspergillus recurvatus]